MNIKINNKQIDNNSLYFVIEEGQANLGDVRVAKKMIYLAKEAGADAIEFQLSIADDFYICTHPLHARYKKIELPLKQIESIIRHAHDNEIDFIAVPLSHNLIKPLVDFGCHAFNINASDINNPSIIDNVCTSGILFFVSLPLANETEIEWITNRIEKLNVHNYTFLHGQHSMASGEDGVDPEHTSLGYLKTLKNKTNKPIGFIDHTPTLWMPSCAVAAGANIISKHLIIDRTLKGPDWRICLEPEEMKEAIKLARNISKSVSTVEKVLAPGENMDISLMRRSIVSSRNLVKNQQITMEDIAFKRPGTGIPPNEYVNILGMKVNKDINKDELIHLNDLDQ